jgi:hypothetical protein
MRGDSYRRVTPTVQWQHWVVLSLPGCWCCCGVRSGQGHPTHRSCHERSDTALCGSRDSLLATCRELWMRLLG